MHVELDPNEWQMILNQLATAQNANASVQRKVTDQLVAQQPAPPPGANGAAVNQEKMRTPDG